MAKERCYNCGDAIGKLEQAFVYNEHIVCKKCNLKLREDILDIKDSVAEISQPVQLPNSDNPGVPDKSKRMTVGSFLLIISAILGIITGSATLFLVLCVAGICVLINECTVKKTKSKALWLAFAGWTVIIIVLIASMVVFYQNPKNWSSPYGDAAGAIWFAIFSGIWFLGGLPIFIAAIVTRGGEK